MNAVQVIAFVIMYALTLLVVTTVAVIMDIIYLKMDILVKVTSNNSCATI